MEQTVSAAICEASDDIGGRVRTDPGPDFSSIAGSNRAVAVCLPYRSSHASRQPLKPQMPQDAADQIRGCDLAGKQAYDVVVAVTSLQRRDSNNHVVRRSASNLGQS